MPSSRCAARATLRQWQGLLRLGLTALSERVFAALQLRPAINAKSAGKPEAGRSNMRYAAEEMPYSLRWNSPIWILSLIGRSKAGNR